MQSLFDLHRRGEPTGGLLGGYTPSNEIVDRATMLPIGQYEDGSLTFAWPGFLKDAYEGAVRSYEQGRQLPRADEDGYYAGTPRAEPLDAFNAASIAPMAGVGMRAAGMADDVVRASPQRQQSFQIPPEADIAAQSSAWQPGWGRIADDLEQPDRFADFRDKIGSLTPDLEPYWANSINPEQYAVDTPFLFVERPRVVQQRAPYEADIDLRNLKTQQPGVWGHKVKSMVETGVQPRTPTGTRFDGGPLPLVRMTENGDYVLVDGNHRMSAEVVKGNDIARALVYANPSESSLPSLGMNALEGLPSLLGNATQPQLASRDMQMLARSMGYDPRRITTHAQEKADELSRSSWASDRAEADRLLALVREVQSNPEALSSLRQSERKSVVDANEARRAAMTSRPVAARDGYKIVRHDDPHRSEVIYRLLDDGDKPVGKAILTGDGNNVQPYMDWVDIDPSHQRKGLGSWLYDSIGADIGKEMRPSGQLTTPEIMSFWEKRSPQKMRDWERGIYANPSESSLPYLMTNGMEEYQLANADPAYDANALVAERWRDKPRIQGEPSSYGFGYIEPPAVFQQERIDPPSMWFKPQPLPPPPLFR